MKIDILMACYKSKPLATTKIMYKSNINCSVLKPMLNELTENNLLSRQCEGKRCYYTITTAGIEILKAYDDLLVSLGCERKMQWWVK